MADEIDIQTQDTLTPERDSGHNQNADLSPEASEDSIDAINALFEQTTGEKPPRVTDPSKPEPKDPSENIQDPVKSADVDQPDPAKTDEPKEGDPADPGDGEPTTEGDTGGGDPEVAAGHEGTSGATAKESRGTDADSKADAVSEIDGVQLPPHTSEKASVSFNLVKQKAKEQIEARDQEIETLKTKLGEFEKSEVVTPEEKAELQELRKLRASLEIEKDPAITKEFSQRIAENESEIYAKLTEAGMTTAQIDTLKKMGGPGKLSNWDAIYAHLSPSQKRVVDSRLTENERLEKDKARKIQEAKADVDRFIEERSPKVVVERESKVIEKSANDMLGQLGWAAKQDVPKDATPEQRKAVEAANKYAAEQIKVLEGLLVDRSPENHATLAIGTIQALYFRKQLDSQTAQIAELRKANEELTGKLGRIRKAGASTRTSAPAKPLKPATDIFDTTAEDAIDALRQQVQGNGG
jgi:hypothetical protein